MIQLFSASGIAGSAVVEKPTKDAGMCLAPRSQLTDSPHCNINAASFSLVDTTVSDQQVSISPIRFNESVWIAEI